MNKTIKWVNEDCGCEKEVVETDVSSHEEIISLLQSGMPICPECGNDMTPVDN